MPKLRLTHSAVNGIIPPERGYIIYKDTRTRGLGLRVLYTGTMTWILEYTFDGKRRRHVIGRFPSVQPGQAETKAISMLNKVYDGIDPAISQRGNLWLQWTFANWAVMYKTSKRPYKASYKDDDLYLGYSMKELPEWIKLADIKTSDIRRIHMKLAAPDADGMPTTPTKANRWLASMSACMNEALLSGHILRNPCQGVKKFKESSPRTRTFDDNEWESITKALESEKLDDQIAFKMLMATGARSSEVLNARWLDIRFDDRMWLLPKTKAGEPQSIPLRDDLTALLKMVWSTRGCSEYDYIIEGAHGGKRDSLRSVWRRIKKNAGIGEGRIHDIRRTVGLRVARKNGLHVASKLLRHSDIRITEKIYAPLSIEELRGAVNGLSVGD